MDEATALSKMVAPGQPRPRKFRGGVIQVWKIKHGYYGTPTYRSWKAMLERCTNKVSQNYPNWGGRGVTVCARWKDFSKFLEDVGERPSLSHSLDRINNCGNYEPGNVRWATVKQQARNRRSNRTITFHGETLTIAGWAEKIGVKYNTLHERLRRGVPFGEALTKAKGKHSTVSRRRK